MKKTILIVEDEVSQRKVLSAYLTKKGFSILEAADGEEGLTIALAQHPDVILLDVRMPKMDGMTMMHKLRADEWGKTVSIIILSNYDTSDTHLFQIILDEPSFYLIKSNVSLDLIFEKLKEVVETKSKTNAAGGTGLATAVSCLCFVLQSGVKLG